jgi:hypothetical protein
MLPYPGHPPEPSHRAEGLVFGRITQSSFHKTAGAPMTITLRGHSSCGGQYSGTPPTLGAQDQGDTDADFPRRYSPIEEPDGSGGWAAPEPMENIQPLLDGVRLNSASPGETGSPATIVDGDTARPQAGRAVRCTRYGIHHLATTAFDNSAETARPCAGRGRRRMCRLHHQAGQEPRAGSMLVSGRPATASGRA